MATNEAHEVGAVLLDKKRDRVGVVITVRDGTVDLRPGGGGESWTARAIDVCAASPRDEMRAKVAEANALRRWSR